MEQTEQRINVEAAKLTPVDCDGEQSTHADERFGDRAFHEEAASTCAPLSSSLLKKRKRGEKAEAMSSIADRDATISEIITHPSLSSHPDEKRRRQKKQKKVTNNEPMTQSREPTSKLVIRDGKVCYEEDPPALGEGSAVRVVDQNGQRVTSSSFKTRNHTEKWKPEETRKFFKGLEIFGSDFSMIANLFPTRTRTQVKNKFRKEERENGPKVEESLKKHFRKRVVPCRVLQSATGEGETATAQSRRDSVDSLDLVTASLSA